MMIDLHCHSINSDGMHTPAELIAKAQAQQLRVLSLTDHDTVAGYGALTAAAGDFGITIINGIELSTRWKKHDIHILGYQLNHTQVLFDMIEQQNNSRIERAQEIGVALQQLGVDDAYAKACDLAGHKRVGRPHFAKVLINEGKTRDMKSAFKQYLGRGRGAYVPTPWASVADAVACIIACGGQAVIAHPLKYGLTRSKLHELINDFKDAGGVGIEVVSGEMTVTEVKEMAATSMRFKLLASSGSDFHGDAVSRIGLGRQRQLPELCTPIWHDWII